jgi:hypothetical protein
MTEQQPPDEAHQRAPGVGDDVVEATGKLSEALEWIERARGRLYDFHQMIGRADFFVGDAADMLADAGHPELAERLRAEIMGRNVLPGRWTFQIVEDFDDGYWGPVRELEQEVRDALLDGKRHLYEAEMKEARRTPGRDWHASRPDEQAR